MIVFLFVVFSCIYVYQARILVEKAKNLEKDGALGREIRKYFKSGNNIPVDRATIRRCDIKHLLEEE